MYRLSMPRISSKNQVTIPVSALDEAGLHPGDEVVIEAVDAGEVLIRRSTLTFEEAVGALTGVYPPRYLETLDEEDASR